MNKRKTIKIIFNVLLTFIVILSISCGDLQVFASVDYLDFIYNVSDTSERIEYYISYRPGNTSGTSVHMTSSPVSIPFDTSFDYYLVDFRRTSYNLNWVATTRYASELIFNYSNGDTVTLSGVSLSTDPDIFHISADGLVSFTASTLTSTHLYFYFVIDYVVITPTPEPTPTPTPAPTPTPLPVDYDDTQFWGRMNNIAEGGWNAVTATFNGIFNNTVFRNLVVYVPLFGAIIYLFVYLLFMGSD